MAIRQTSSIGNVQQMVQERMRRAALLKLRYVGETCVKEARLTGSYTDRTGNLRSSVGYVIVDNGTIDTLAGFETVKSGAEGQKNGSKFAQSLAAKYHSGLVLIVVAGMNYAAYVQRRGYNVLASAELIAEDLLSKMNLKKK